MISPWNSWYPHGDEISSQPALRASKLQPRPAVLFRHNPKSVIFCKEITTQPDIICIDMI